MGAKSLNAKILIQAPPRRIWNALTKPAILSCWLAESDDINLRKKGYIKFGGRYSFAFQPGDPVRRPIRELERDESIAFDWHLRDETGNLLPTRVTWRVGASGGGSLFELNHDVKDYESGAAWNLADAWSVYLNGLSDLMEGRESFLRFDYSARNKKEIFHSVFIRGSAEEIFSALHNTEQIKHYFTRTAKLFEHAEGGAIDLGWNDAGPSKVITFDPPRLLSYDWKNIHSGKITETLKIEWRIAPEGPFSRVSVAVSGFPGGRAIEGSGDDLEWASVLCELKRFVETGRRAVLQEIMDQSSH